MFFAETRHRDEHTTVRHRYHGEWSSTKDPIGICIFPKVFGVDPIGIWGGPPVNLYFYSVLPKNLNLHKIIFPPFVP